jgi:ATP-binding cassette, subfamily B, bacterial
MSPPGIDSLAWPLPRLGEAISRLAHRTRLADIPRHRGAGMPPPMTPPVDGAALAPWVAGAAARLGMEAERLRVCHADAERLLRARGPLLVQLGAEPRFLLLLTGGPRRAVLLGPDGRSHRCASRAIAAALRAPIEAPLAAEIADLLARADVPLSRRLAAQRVLLAERCGQTAAGDVWHLRLPPSAGFGRQMRQTGLPAHLAGFAAGYSVELLLWLASWYLIAQGARRGWLDPGWLWGWALLLLTLVPFRLLATWKQGAFAIGLGTLLKQRLLHGMLRMEPQEVRELGIGQHVGRVLESSSVESLAITGGLQALFAVIQLAVAALVLAAGASGRLEIELLALWSAVVLTVAWRYDRRRTRWSDRRLAMSHDLIEQMIGHRTRLVQQPPERRHDAEDEALDAYLRESAAMDRTSGLELSPLPRGWLLVGLAGLAPSFLAGRGSTPAFVAGLGGVLLAYRAFSDLVAGMVSLVRALVAWRQVRPLAAAGARREPAVPLWPGAAAGGASARGAPGATVVDAERISFRYPGRARPALQDCSLRIGAGERYLLTGPSGSGKSTLAAILAGMRQPQSGLLLARGLDLRTLGAGGWRRMVALAPQFHENYVFTGTLAFNLLLGRRWPPLTEDLREAEQVWRALGLGDLLDSMPSGLHQLLGESGWQLSHGERSRLFLARALLQGAELVVLDESFAALDPETRELCLRRAAELAPALLVVAHW